MDGGHALAQKLLRSLGDLAYLDLDAATSRLQGAFLSTSSMQSLQSFFSTTETDRSCSFNDTDYTHDIETLGNSSMAYVMSKIDDPWGFKDLCHTDGATLCHDILIDALMPALFAEHINRHLSEKGLEPLNKLRDDNTLVEGFSAEVTSPFFDPIGERHDLHYAMTLLFVYEYLQQGPKFRLNTALEALRCFPIIEQWKDKLVTPGADDNKQTLAKYAYMISAVFSPSGRASDTILETVQGVAKLLAPLSSASEGLALEFGRLAAGVVPDVGAEYPDPEAGTIFDSSVIEEYHSVSRRVWIKWGDILNDQTPSTFWQSGIRKAEGKITVSQTLVNGSPTVTLLRKTTVNGPELASWHATNIGASYINADARLSNVTVEAISPIADLFKHPPQGLTCFIAGTNVRTRHGDVPIEVLQEGDEIVTRLQPTQWGIRSCEVVRSPAPKLIFGFNQEAAFFTAGHVFHTTTGLRAIQPEVARAENPWIEVGQLGVGHQLLRIKDDDSYEVIPIHSIHSEDASGHGYVYGVHLREGLRSYHANGYLVALNYPEITVSMIAKRLVMLEPAERLAILKSARDLQPIFDRFGDGTVLEMLSRESKTSSLSFGGKVDPARPFLLRDVDMPYNMTFSDDSTHGPQLELLQGILYVDGDFCERASFDKESLSWSRPISNDTWEHGHCKFSHDGQQAFGRLLHATDEEAEAGDEVLAKARAFSLTPGALQLAEHPLVAAALKPSMLVAKSATYFPGAEELTVTAESMPRATGVTAGRTRQPITFALSYDPSTYEPGGAGGNMSTRCGNIILPVEANRFSFAKLHLEDYDKVRDKLIDKAKTEHSQFSSLKVPDFYKHTVRYDSKQMEHHRFELTQASAIIESSDEYQAWKAANRDHYLDMDSELPLKNLHYRNLGLGPDFVITEVFQTLDLVKSLPDFQGLITLSGMARSYSSTSQGNEGPAHHIVGTYVKPSTRSIGTAPHRRVSRRVSTMPTRAFMTEHMPPLAFAMSLSTDTAQTEEEILNQLGSVSLNLRDVNSSAQATMNNVMQWHMKDEERRLFFNATDKPVGLPAEFTTLLENTSTATWIRDVYAKAYICQILTQSDGKIRSEYNFTAQEKKNVRYFWSGRGKNSLARSPIYAKLERAISRYEIREMHSIIGKVYDEGKGVYYSNLLYDRWTSDFLIDDLAKVDPTSGTSFLSKICTIMDALDDGAETKYSVSKTVDSDIEVTDTNSNQLVFAATSYQKSETWKKQYWGFKTDDERSKFIEDEWLDDTMKELIKRLLDQDPRETNQVTKTLGAELEKYGKTVEGWQDMSKEEKVLNLLADLGGRLQHVVKIMGKLLGWVKQGSSWVWQRGKQMVANWRGNARAAGDAVEHVMEERPVGLVKGPLLKSVLFIVAVAAVGVTIWAVSNRFSDAHASDKGRMVTTVLASLNQMAEFGVDAAYTIMRYSKKGALSEAAELAIYAKFDEYTSKNLGSGWASLVETTDRKLLVRDLKVIRDGAGAEILPIEKEAADLREVTVKEALESLDKTSRFRGGFNIARGVISAIGYILSIGLAIFMTWSLVSNWDKMDTGTRVFETIQVALQLIEATVAVVVVGGYIAWGVAIALGSTLAPAIGTFAVAAASVFAAVALVVAIVAIFVLVVYLIWDLNRPLPPNAVETWIKDNGKPWAQAHPSPEDPLQASVSPQSLEYSSDVQTIRVTFTNQTSTDQEVSSIVLKFASGADGGALFVDEKRYQKGTQAVAGNATMEGAPQGSQLDIVNHPNVVVENHTDTTLTIRKTKTEDDSANPVFTVLKNKPITMTLFGVVRNDNGDPVSLKWSAFTKDDVSTGELKIQRAKKP